MPTCEELVRDPANQGRLGPGNTLSVPGLPARLPMSVYLPPDYHSSDRHYPLAILLDGQNLFSDEASFAGGWHAHDLMNWRSCQGERVPIVLALHTVEYRTEMLTPWPTDDNPIAWGAGFVDWLADELVPLAHEDLRVLPGRENTLLGGSSLGGLLALFAFFNRPDTFGRAMAMSASAMVRDGRVDHMVEMVAHLPFPQEGRLYLDAGAHECPCQSVMRQATSIAEVLHAKGLQEGRHYWFRVDPEGGHNEAAWRYRLPGAMAYLLD